jgi:O-antigen/teichoic acid export membrane protein
MKENFSLPQLWKAALISIVVGLIIGMTGAVRTGSIILSMGASIFVITRYYQLKVKRKIELYLPLLICIMLFLLALSLPNAR